MDDERGGQQADRSTGDAVLSRTPGSGVHANQPLLHHGPNPREARCTVILLHGRGDSAAGILTLTDEVDVPDVAWLAPQAATRSWYPYSFLAPTERNEPALSSALDTIGALLAHLAAHAIGADRVLLAGFSQGACLVSEFGARHPRRYAGIAALSGGLIGPPETPRRYSGTFAGTPTLFGCGDADTHIPFERVEESVAAYRAMGADVDARIYPGLGHTIVSDEIDAMRTMLLRVR